MPEDRYAGVVKGLIRRSIDSGALFCLTASGHSMLPSIRHGCGIVIKKVRPDTITLGDIIVFEKNNELCVHRILYKNKNGFTTKGDNCFAADNLVKRGDILGKVVGIRSAGRVTWLDKGFWKAIGRVIGVFSYIESLVYARLREIKKGVFYYAGA